MLDHLQSLCDYIINFYYLDKANNSKPVDIKEAASSWKSLLPFANCLLTKLSAHNYMFLYGLASRLVALIRYRIFERTSMAFHRYLASHPAAQKKLSMCSISDGILQEFTSAEKWFQDSEKYFSYPAFIEEYPETYQNVCLRGDVSAGITVGGEAGVEIGPMFPFMSSVPIHLAAIVTKCILAEYIKKNNIPFKPIDESDLF